jgi:Spy/CpxP family protein refolding chaperone
MKERILVFASLLLGAHLFGEPPISKSTARISLPSEVTISPLMNPFPQLNLTPEQTAEARKIDKEGRRGIALALAHLRTVREALDIALLTNPRDGAGIHEKSAAVGKAVGEITVQEALNEARFLQILTPVQLLQCQRISSALQRRRPQ